MLRLVAVPENFMYRGMLNTWVAFEVAIEFIQLEFTQLEIMLFNPRVSCKKQEQQRCRPFCLLQWRALPQLLSP